MKTKATNSKITDIAFKKNNYNFTKRQNSHLNCYFRVVNIKSEWLQLFYFK